MLLCCKITEVHADKACEYIIWKLTGFFCDVQCFPIMNTSMGLCLFANTICDVVITRKDNAHLQKTISIWG